MPRHPLRLVWCLFLCLLAATSVGAQDAAPIPSPAPPVEAPAATDLEARIAALDSATDLDQATRDAITAAYREAIDSLKRRDDANARRAQSERDTAAAPALLASIRAELTNPPAEPTLDIPPDSTLAVFEQGLAQAQAQLTAARADADLLAAEAARRDERRPAISTQIADLRKRLTETLESIAALPPGDTSPTADAQLARLLAKRDYLAAEIDAMDKEAVSYTARVDLLPARRDLATRKITEAQRVVDAWQARLAEKKLALANEAATKAQELEQEAAQNSVLKQFAEENIRLANLRVGPEGSSARPAIYESRFNDTLKEIANIRAGYQSVQERIRASDFNRATGLLLRLQYADLPQPQSLKRELSTLESQLERAELDRIDLEDKRQSAGDINGVVQELLADALAAEANDPANNQPSRDPAEVRAALEKVAKALATNRLDTLDNLIIDADKETTALLSLTDAVSLHHQAVVEYRAYIEERILWIRSIDDKNLRFVPELATATAWILSPTEWRSVLDATVRAARSTPAETSAAFLFIVFTFLLRRIASRRLIHLSKLVGNYKTDSFALTLRALAHTIAAGFFLASIFLVLSWLLRAPPDQTPLGLAVGDAFRQATPLAFVLSFARAALRSRGLFASHFRWPSAAVAHLRRELRWFMPVVLPVVVLSHAFENHNDDSMIATLGRLTFTVHMVALALYVHDVLSPRGPTMSEYLKRASSRILSGARYIWYPLAIVLPLSLAAVSWLGYHYTAIQLFTQVQYTLFLVTILIVVYALMLRWLFVTRRAVAIDTARRRREQVKVEDGAEQPAPIDADRLDLPAISAQTQKLFGLSMAVAAIIGLFSIWSPVLPALRMLENVEVWPAARVVGATEDLGVPILERQLITPAPQNTKPADASATPPTNGTTSATKPASPTIPGSPIDSMNKMLHSGDEETPPEDITPDTQTDHLVVTLADIGISLIVLIATFLAFRNFPGLLEILILTRLPLDAGIRYALSTIFRYVIAIIGLSIAFSAIGLSWSKVQWLAAALTFGLAFGLQEIFANFVSGVIILIERPVRIGDTVTVGTTTGDVSRIRMRATTITDWERKELIIPNKTFITGDVINWTLTDPVLRVTIPVGVSYGSDVDQVVRVLQKIATDARIVLADPAPVVLFGGFGDSTLDFQLRVFIPSIKNFVEVRHLLHMTIMKTFRAEGIEIAFPQRDLHIRSADAELLIKNAKPTEPTIESDPPRP